MFANANLDTIHGLAGVLSSTGEFHGPINRIEVEGTTDTPNFQVDAGGSPVPLKTRFTAVVDGSDGDTYLQQVDASFFDTSMTAKGAVIGLEGVPGRRIEVDVDMANGRIEDLLRLAVQSDKPILLGAARLKAKLVIPPEKKKVIDKLQLAGEFVLSRRTFTDAGVQRKLTGFSRRGQGMGKDEEIGEVLSELARAVRRRERRGAIFEPDVFGPWRSGAARRPIRPARRDDRLQGQAENAGHAVAGRGRRREGILSEGVRSVFQGARRGNGAAHQDCGHAESAEIRARCSSASARTASR